MLPTCELETNILGWSGVSQSLVPTFPTYPLISLRALANEDTLLRTHCCSWCFLGCANWETFVADTKCFWTKSETIFVSREFVSVTNNARAARAFVSATMPGCPQCVLVCQGLKAGVNMNLSEILLSLKRDWKGKKGLWNTTRQLPDDQLDLRPIRFRILEIK